MSLSNFRNYLSTAAKKIILDPELRVIYTVFIAVFLVTEVYTQALPLHFDSLGIPLTLLGVAKSVSKIFEVAASPVSGVFSDRYSRMSIAFFSGMIMIVLFAFFGFASNFIALLLLMCGVSIVHVFLNNSLTPAVDEALEEGFEGIGWGVRDVGLYLGSAIGLGIGGLILSWTSNTHLIFVAVIPVLGAMTGLIWMSRDDDEKKEMPTSPSEMKKAIKDAEVGLIPEYRDISNWDVLARFCIIEALVIFGMGMSMFLLPIFGKEVGISAGVVLLVYSGSNFFGAPLSLVGGVLADHYSRKWLYVGNFVTETIMLAVFAVTQSPLFFILGMGMFVIQTTFEPAVGAYFFDQFPEEEAGRAWSVEGTVAKVVGMVAPVVGGFVYSIDPNLVYLIGAVLTGLGTLVSLTLPE